MLVIVFQVTTCLKMIWVSIVNFLIIFVEDLEFEEVDALLEEVYVAEVLNVQHKLSSGSVHVIFICSKICLSRWLSSANL